MAKTMTGGSGVDGLTIGVIGGTGAQGRGLALRWGALGLPVILGSRDSKRAEDAAAELNEQLTTRNGAALVRRADKPGDRRESRCRASCRARIRPREGTWRRRRRPRRQDRHRLRKPPNGNTVKYTVPADEFLPLNEAGGFSR